MLVPRSQSIERKEPQMAQDTEQPELRPQPRTQPTKSTPSDERVGCLACSSEDQIIGMHLFVHRCFGSGSRT